MADIHIRDVDPARYRQLKRQAVDDGVSMKELVLRMLGFPIAGEPQVKPSPRPKHAVGCKCAICVAK